MVQKQARIIQPRHLRYVFLPAAFAMELAGLLGLSSCVMTRSVDFDPGADVCSPWSSRSTQWHDGTMNDTFEIISEPTASTDAVDAVAVDPPRPTTWEWIREGLRAGLLLAPRRATAAPRPIQLAIIVALVVLLELGLSRLEVPGPALFNAQAWLAPWWSMGLIALVAWWALQTRPGAPITEQAAPVSAWFALWLSATLPLTLVGHGLAIAIAIANGYGTLPSALNEPMLAWSLYGALWFWLLLVGWRVTAHFAPATVRGAILVTVVLLASAVTTWQFPARPWDVDDSQTRGEEPARLQLSQQVFEAQQKLMQEAIAKIAPRHQGVANVYGLVYAPYAGEDVFLRESGMVATVLAERFDAAGRVLHLVNHVGTVGSHPWATPLNLERAIQALGERMDRERDLLVVYLTSHGASDFKLASNHWPLSVEPLQPTQLRAALDKAAIKHRVIAVSACYSGGWIEPLANAHTLVMTAADATHTSYGCGRKSELTFFGRAMFDEQLRLTHSFEAAFTSAVSLIKQREIDAGKSDGFSNPQISIGASLRPLMLELEQSLGELKPEKAR